MLDFDTPPKDYREIDVPDVVRRECSGARAFHRRDGLRVIVTVDDFPDGAGRWLHASVSYEDRLPRWRVLTHVQRELLGEVVCIQLLPPREHWLNLHPYCLHLFHRLDGDTIHEALYK